MEITVGKKKFKIERVSMYISEMWADLVQMTYDLANPQAKLDRIDVQRKLDIAESDGLIDRYRAELKGIKAIDEIKKDAEKLTEEIYELRFKILEEVLRINGYDFDRDLWYKESSTEDVNDMIVGLLGDKKKAE